MNEEYRFKNEGARVTTIFSLCKCMVTFPDTQGQLTLQSNVRTNPRVYAFSHYLQE